MKYAFPAIFTPDSGAVSVSFPDLPGCATFGTDIPDALDMAADALNTLLASDEERSVSIPAASDVRALSCPPDSFVSLVSADTDAWRRAHSERAVKKTLTLPMWLNEAAEARGVNFSQVLQEALKNRLGLSNP